MLDHVVIIKLDDEPPKEPIVTGVVGPFEEEKALEWANNYLAKFDIPESTQAKPKCEIVPLISPEDPGWFHSEIQDVLDN